MSQQDAGNVDERTVPLTLTRYDIDRIMHFAHFIPVKKGLHQKHIDDKYPGWTWNQMVRLLRDTGVLIERAGGGVSLPLETRIPACQQTARNHRQWDENVVEDDERFYYAGKDTDFDQPSLGDIMREALPGVDLGDQGQGSFFVPASKIIDHIADSEITDGGEGPSQP